MLKMEILQIFLESAQNAYKHLKEYEFQPFHRNIKIWNAFS